MFLKLLISTTIHSQRETDNAILGFFVPLVILVFIFMTFNPIKAFKQDLMSQIFYHRPNRLRMYFGILGFILLTLAGLYNLVKFIIEY